MNIGLLILIVFLLIYIPLACVCVYIFSKMVDKDCSIYYLNIKNDIKGNTNHKIPLNITSTTKHDKSPLGDLLKNSSNTHWNLDVQMENDGTYTYLYFIYVRRNGGKIKRRIFKVKDVNDVDDIIKFVEENEC